jgi:fatty-acyl-CoA synthase
LPSEPPLAAPERAAAETVKRLPEGLELGAARGAGLTLVDAQLNETPVSYASLRDDAERVAAALREHGLKPGDRVSLVGSTSLQLLQALFGAWRAGLVPSIGTLPRNPAQLDVWLEGLATRSRFVEARAVLSAEAFSGLLGDRGIAPLTLTVEQLAAHGHGIDEPIGGAPDDVAYLQFTSGSTGASRAVALTHLQILSNVFDAVTRFLVLRGEDVRVSWLPLYHDFGLIWLLSAVCVGAPMVLQPPEEFLRRPGSWMDACSRYGAAATGGPNQAFGLATRDLRWNPRELDLERLRIVLNGSEPIDVGTVEGFLAEARRHGLPANASCPSYGLAEATLAVSSVRPEAPVRTFTVDRDELADRRVARLVEGEGDRVRKLVGCGYTPEVTDLRVVDDDGADLPPWRVGEILVRGPSVMAGYWGDEEATAAVVRDGWLHTGDLGFLTDDGEIVPCGRIKDMIIVAGRNVYPEECELVAEHVDGVRRGNTIAFSLSESERMVVVAETKLPPEEVDGLAERVHGALRSALEGVPAEVVVVPAGTLPKTSSGKRQRRACRDQYAAGELPALANAG